MIFRLILTIQLISLSVNLIVGIVIGLIVSSNIQGLGFEAKQGIFIEVLVLGFMNLAYFVNSSTCYLIMIKKVRESNVLRGVSFYAGILITSIPMILATLEDMREDSAYTGEIMFIISGVVTLVIWTVAYIIMEREIKAKIKTSHDNA